MMDSPENEIFVEELEKFVDSSRLEKDSKTVLELKKVEPELETRKRRLKDLEEGISKWEIGEMDGKERAVRGLLESSLEDQLLLFDWGDWDDGGCVHLRDQEN